MTATSESDASKTATRTCNVHVRDDAGRRLVDRSRTEPSRSVPAPARYGARPRRVRRRRRGRERRRQPPRAGCRRASSSRRRLLRPSRAGLHGGARGRDAGDRERAVAPASGRAGLHRELRERCREIHRAAAEAVDGRDDAVALLGIAGTDDADAADYAEELDLGHPLAVAPERVWLSYAAREPGSWSSSARMARSCAAGPGARRLPSARPRRALRRVTRVAVLAALALAAACGGRQRDRRRAADRGAGQQHPRGGGRVRRRAAVSRDPPRHRLLHRGSGRRGRRGRRAARGASRERRPERRLGVERIPTVCVFGVEVDLPERARYRLVLPDTLPLEFERGFSVRSRCGSCCRARR